MEKTDLQQTLKLTVSDNKHNKWILGFDSTVNSEARFSLDKFVTTNADGFVSTIDDSCINFLRINVSENANFLSDVTFKDQVRYFNEKASVIEQNDGKTHSFKITKTGEPSSQSNELRPLSFSLCTGNVTIKNGATLSGETKVDNLVLTRQNDKINGGKITFSKALDGSEFWHNDTFGSDQLPTLRWHHSGSVRMNLDSDGRLTTSGDIGSFSDASLKMNVNTIDNALSKVMLLRGVEFQRIDDESSHVGVIAQEVESVVPQVVSEVSGIKTVAYGNLVGVLIEAIKELKAEIDCLKLNNTSNP